MNLNEATHILKSVGYNIERDLDSAIDSTIELVLESMERRGAVRTQAYKIISEMAIKRPKTITDENPWNDSDERFSKLQAAIQSKMTRGGEPRASTKAGWVAELDAIEDEVSNPAVLRELPNLKAYLTGETDMYVSANPNNTGALTGNFATDRKNISSSISTLGSHGGKNYQALLDRIDELEAQCGEEVTDAEANAIEKLRTDLETARQKAEGINATKGKTAIFRPAVNTDVAKRRINRRLTQNGIEFNENEDGTITITSKVRKAKEVLAELGEFVEPQAAPAAPAAPTELTFTVDQENADFINDIVSDNNGTMTYEDGVVTINGTARQIAAIQAELRTELPEIFETEAPAEEAPAEEPVEEDDAPTVIEIDPDEEVEEDLAEIED